MKYYSEYENKKVCYEESFWTGKKNIKIEDTEVKLLSKKKLLLNDKEYNIKGNSIIGVELISSDEKITILNASATIMKIFSFSGLERFIERETK